MRLKNKNDFENDLVSLSERLGYLGFARNIYAALCNVQWKPIGGEHEPGCMLVTGELPDHVKKGVKVITLKDGERTERLPDPWCDCGLAYSCSWRYAGGLVADIRDQGENYLHFYCGGGEGNVTDDVLEALRDLGWEPVPRGKESARGLITITMLEND